MSTKLQPARSGTGSFFNYLTDCCSNGQKPLGMQAMRHVIRDRRNQVEAIIAKGRRPYAKAAVLMRCQHQL